MEFRELSRLKNLKTLQMQGCLNAYVNLWNFPTCLTELKISNVNLSHVMKIQQVLPNIYYLKIDCENNENETKVISKYIRESYKHRISLECNPTKK